jgi:hypothetical protein
LFDRGFYFPSSSLGEEGGRFKLIIKGGEKIKGLSNDFFSIAISNEI